MKILERRGSKRNAGNFATAKITTKLNATVKIYADNAVKDTKSLLILNRCAIKLLFRNIVKINDRDLTQTIVFHVFLFVLVLILFIF